MTPMPAVYNRCRPVEPSEQCHNCKRWIDHPEQTIWNVVPLVNVRNHQSKACVHVPISRMQ